MTQAATFGVPSGPPASPVEMALRINQSLQALLTLNAGVTEPVYKTQGTLWLSLAETPWPLSIYDGEHWALLGALDPEAGTFAFNIELSQGIDDIEGLTTALAGKVPTTRQVSAGGLATGGGALSGDITITVPAASQAEAQGGTENSKAMTALRVAQAIAALALPDGAVTTAKLGAAAVTLEKMAAGAAVQGGAMLASGSGQILSGRSGDNLQFRRILVTRSVTGSGNGVSDVNISIGTSGNDITITLSVTKTNFTVSGGGGG